VKIVSAIALFLLCLVQAASAHDRVRLANGEWPPYLGSDLKHYGVASRIVTDAFALGGIEVEYGFFPWLRSMMLAKQGTWDGTLVWFSSTERRKMFYVSDPVIISTYVFFHRKDMTFDWRTMEDLKGCAIGATVGYDYGEAFQKAERQGLIRVERVPTDEMNLKKLVHGRTDIFPIDREVGLSMMRKHLSEADRNRLTFHPLPLRTDPLCLLLSRKVSRNSDRIKVFNAGLRRLKEQGKVNRYLREALTFHP